MQKWREIPVLKHREAQGVSRLQSFSCIKIVVAVAAAAAAAAVVVVVVVVVGQTNIYLHILSFFHAVVQLVEALRYKLKSRGFDSQWCHWDSSLT
jgi:type IV secretory pathway VirB3-like protein